MDNQQPSPLTGEGSTTIPEGSTEDVYPWEKPNSIFYNITTEKSVNLPKVR